MEEDRVWVQTIVATRTKQMAGGAADERHKEMVFGGPLPWNACFETKLICRRAPRTHECVGPPSLTPGKCILQGLLSSIYLHLKKHTWRSRTVCGMECICSCLLHFSVIHKIKLYHNTMSCQVLTSPQLQACWTEFPVSETTD